jgi:large subunit ribosomal protein L24
MGGRVKVDRGAAAVGDIEFQYGDEGLPINLPGSATLFFASPKPRFFASLSSSLASGRVSSIVSIDRGDRGMAARVRIQFTDNEIADLLPVAGRPISGRLAATVNLSGSGTSLDAVIRSLEGKADVKVQNGVVQRLDPAAFNAVISAVDQGLPIDERRIRDRMEQALAVGPFKFSLAEGQLAATGTSLRLDEIAVRAVGADLKMKGSVELATSVIDTGISLVGQISGPEPNLRPEVAIMLRGPIDAPRRSLDVAAFTSWLALRAVDQQAKRLDALEKRQ